MALELLDNLFLIAEVFDSEGIDYALCGGIAVALHGYSRFTKDIDILIREDDLSRALAPLSAQGFKFTSGILPFDDFVMDIDE